MKVGDKVSILHATPDWRPLDPLHIETVAVVKVTKKTVVVQTKEGPIRFYQSKRGYTKDAMRLLTRSEYRKLRRAEQFLVERKRIIKFLHELEKRSSQIELAIQGQVPTVCRDPKAARLLRLKMKRILDELETIYYIDLR